MHGNFAMVHQQLTGKVRTRVPSRASVPVERFAKGALRLRQWILCKFTSTGDCVTRERITCGQ